MKKTEYTCDWCRIVIGPRAHRLSMEVADIPFTDLELIHDRDEASRLWQKENRALLERRKRNDERIANLTILVDRLVAKDLGR